MGLKEFLIAIKATCILETLGENIGVQQLLKMLYLFKIIFSGLEWILSSFFHTPKKDKSVLTLFVYPPDVRKELELCVVLNTHNLR